LNTFEHSVYVSVKVYIHIHIHQGKLNLVIALSKSPQRFNARRWGDGDAKAELIALASAEFARTGCFAYPQDAS